MLPSPPLSKLSDESPLADKLPADEHPRRNSYIERCFFGEEFVQNFVATVPGCAPEFPSDLGISWEDSWGASLRASWRASTV